MKNLIYVFAIHLLLSSCATNMTLNQVKLKKGTKLINHYENDNMDKKRLNGLIVYETKEGAIASIKLEEDKIRVSINKKSDLNVVDTISIITDLDIDPESELRLANSFAYYSKLKKLGLKIKDIDLMQDGVEDLDYFEKDLNGAYIIAKKLVYTDNKPVFQTLTIPFKFRFANNDKPGEVSTGFNAGIAWGYQWNLTKIKPIYSVNDNLMKGYNKKEISFSLSPFAGLNAVKLNKDNTGDVVTTEKNVLGISLGVVGVVSVNKFNIGLAGGVDYGLDEDAQNWDHQGQCWAGLVLGLDLIK